ncbi:hypothetical protein LTS18_007056 [Coniosporium uncinatum]|uniref:Uncharacterized protein n=1 Tax=Coniosporium uncinatum TaxID=93489 RepID=A0ACC3DQ02_9PEZI|nr:hypothetical protein LTS18_007056 [Coniosporium uncinatum]
MSIPVPTRTSSYSAHTTTPDRSTSHHNQHNQNQQRDADELVRQFNGLSTYREESSHNNNINNDDDDDGNLQAADSASNELTSAIDDLLMQLSNKFSTVSTELLAKMDDMSRRLDSLEATIQANAAKRHAAEEK